DLLRAHGIQMRRSPQVTGGVERFAIDSSANYQTFEGHNMRRLEGKWEPSAEPVLPAGYWMVPMNQPLARLAFYLLEPASDDGLVNWNVLDDELRDAKAYPILRKR